LAEEYEKESNEKIKKRTYEEDLKRLEELAADEDPEAEHYEADKILLKYVPKEIADRWEKVRKWYA